MNKLSISIDSMKEGKEKDIAIEVFNDMNGMVQGSLRISRTCYQD